MAAIDHRNTRHAVTHNPARLLDVQMAGVPESWQHCMQLMRPIDGLNICCMHGSPGENWMFQAEGEPNLSMSILLDGQMEAGVEDGDAFRLAQGQALLLTTGQHLGGWDVLSAKDDFHLLNINLTPKALWGLTGLQIHDVLAELRDCRCAMAHVDACVASMPVFSALQRVAGEICRCGHAQAPVSQVLLCAKVAECLAVMLGHCARAHRNGPCPATAACDRTRLMRAHTLLEQRHGESWSVQSLARAVGLNEKRLQAGFQALYGCTVHECLTRIRLDAAQALLAAGHSVTDTAQRTGFANLSHFSKLFRQHLGISPKRWGYGSPSADQP